MRECRRGRNYFCNIDRRFKCINCYIDSDKINNCKYEIGLKCINCTVNTLCSRYKSELNSSNIISSYRKKSQLIFERELKENLILFDKNTEKRRKQRKKDKFFTLTLVAFLIIIFGVFIYIVG